MPHRAVVLFSGGLDSMLAVRILQAQGIDVDALTFRTLFTCCQDQAAQGARELGVRLSIASTEDDYLDLIRRPQHGYGRGANPCVDCRIYMFRRARTLLDELGADFVASGEVLGQRPMSQKRRDLLRIAHHADLDDRLVRPLSARLLPETAPERAGLLDRSRLYAFSGRSRKGLIALAQQLGIPRIPTPSTGCALTEVPLGQRVFDLLEHQPDNRRWDFELLQVGRHERLSPTVKCVLGRREAENRLLEALAARDDAQPATLVLPANFLGPAALLVGPDREAHLPTVVPRLAKKRCQEPFSAPAPHTVDVWLLERHSRRRATFTLDADRLEATPAPTR